MWLIASYCILIHLRDDHTSLTVNPVNTQVKFQIKSENVMIMIRILFH